MSKPSNPLEVVIKNRFFKDGLREVDIYNYWVKNKYEILNNLGKNKAILYISSSPNQTIVRRYINKEVPFQITNENYEKILSGRVVGVLRVFDISSDFGIIDIDSPKMSDEISTPDIFNQVKDVSIKVYDYFNRLFDCQLFYTGKNGFHIRCNFLSKINMRRIKSILENHINTSELKKFMKKRNEISPNIDLSPNMVNGGFIIPGSLNKIGLPCVEVKRKDILQFKRENLIGDVVIKDDKF